MPEEAEAGERIAWAREVASVSARAFGRSCGISGMTIRNIELGRKALGLPVARQIADMLGVSLDWLVAGKGKRPAARRIRAAVQAALAARRVQSECGSAHS